MRKLKPKEKPELPPYANGRNAHEWYEMSFFRSDPMAPQDWTWVNENGVFSCPKMAFEYSHKGEVIKVMVGWYHGLYTAAADCQTGYGSLRGSGSLPWASKAQTDGYTSEQEAVRDVFGRIHRFFADTDHEKARSSPAYKAFCDWEREYGKPVFQQLTLF